MVSRLIIFVRFATQVSFCVVAVTRATERLCRRVVIEVVAGELHRPNEKKMSDGGRELASLGVGVWKSSQNVDAGQPAVRSVAWLSLFGLLEETSHIGLNALAKLDARF